MTAPPAQRVGQVVIMHGPAVVEVARIVGFGIAHQAAYDAIPPSPGLLRVHQLLIDAAEEYRRDVRHGSLTSAPDQAALPHGLPDEITTAQAAVLLRRTERTVYRLADQLGAVRRRPLMFDRTAVEAYAGHRPTRRTA